MRALYLVYAAYIGSNGNFATLTGYPKTFDSNSYGEDTELTRKRAYADYHEALGAMGKVDTRQEQIAMIIDMETGMQIESFKIGDLNPDSTGE